MHLTAGQIRDNKSVVLSKRPVQETIVAYLNETIDKQNSLEYFFENKFDREVVISKLQEDLPEGSTPEGKENLINDMVHLGEAFFHTTLSKHVRFQLEFITGDMCRLFHTDRMRQRILCTYLGPGTEWLHHSNVKREGLRKGNNDNIVRDYDKVNKSQPFEVILLKGSLHENAGKAVVHRSPPIMEQKITRVLFKVDEVSDPSQFDLI